MAFKSNAGLVMKRLGARIKKAQAQVPKILANVGQQYFLSNFEKQAWRDVLYKKWPARKNKGNKRPLLIGRTRRLRQSVQRSVKSATPQRIVWGSDVPYAPMHNEGYKGIVHVKAHHRRDKRKDKYGIVSTGAKQGKRSTRIKFGRTREGRVQMRKHTRKMNIPQRKFMGTSKVLSALLIQKYKQILNAIQ